MSVSIHCTLKGHKAPIMMLRYNCSGTMIASASGDKTVRLWDTVKLVPLAILEGHSRYVTSVSFSDDGALVAAGGGDRCIHIWKVSDAIKTPNQNHSRRVMSKSALPSQFLRDNKKLVNWSIEDVCSWMAEQGLAEYTHNVRAQAIDGRELMILTDSILEIKLGIGKFTTVETVDFLCCIS